MPSSGDLPNPGMQTASLVSPALAGRFFTRVTRLELINSFSSFNPLTTLQGRYFHKAHFIVKLMLRGIKAITQGCFIARLIYLYSRAF